MSKSNPENTNKRKLKPEAAGPKPGAGVKAKRAAAAGDQNTAAHSPGAKDKNPTKKVQRAPEIKQLQTANPELPTEKQLPTVKNMDVQHHPQLHHNHKPWKEYLLEGVMIFIAVMLGFISENIRETITNDQHVKQLTSRLVQDLKVDTAQLAQAYAGEAEIQKNNDSLFKLLQLPLAKADTKKIQLFIAGSHSLWQFHPSAVSIAAIKNELYLKQFSDSEIISYIATYEKHIALLQTGQDITLKYQRSFLDPFILAHFTPANMRAVFSQPSSAPTAQMRNLTQEDLTQLATSVVLIRINTHELLRDNQLLKDDALNLLHYVTRQYRLEEK